MVENIKIVVLLIVLMIDIRWFSYVLLDYNAYLVYAKLISVIMFVYVIVKNRCLRNNDVMFVREIVCLMCLPFISAFIAFLFHNQELMNTFNISSMHLGYSLFLIMVIWRVSYKKIKTVILVLGLLWCIIEIVQQFTAPAFLFSNSVALLYDLDVGNDRNGIYRYMPLGYQFGLIFLFYFFQQYLNKKNLIYLVAIILGLAGVYFTATRQTIVVTIVCLIIGLFISKKIQFKSLIGILILAFVVFQNFDSLFGDFITKTVDKNDMSAVARYNAYRIYGYELNDWNPFLMIFGNGDPGRGSLYARAISHIEISKMAVRADIGVVGMYYTYGLLYVSIIIQFIFKVFSKWKYVDLYFKLFVFFVICTSPMLWHFGYSSAYIGIYSFIYYLLAKNISLNVNKCA